MGNHTNILKQRAAQAKRDYVGPPVSVTGVETDETTPEGQTPSGIAVESPTRTVATDTVITASVTPPADTVTKPNRSK